MKAELVQVIRSEHQRGRGGARDPLRTVISYHTPDGELIAEQDPCAEDSRPSAADVEIAVGGLRAALKQAIEHVERHNKSAGAVTDDETLARWRRELERAWGG
jgi:hypothetical protein